MKISFKKKVIPLMLSFVLIIAVIPFGTFTASAGTYNACGENLTWEYESYGNTLTISGEGNMYDFPYDDTPWYSFKNSIKSVVINKGVTKIGDYAFYECAKITSVKLPSGLYSIGECSFFGCKSLKSVTFPSSLINLGICSFCDCSSLKSLVFPPREADDEYGMGLPNGVFAGCTGLTSVTLSDRVEYIYSNVFGGCTGLTSITIPGSVETIYNSAFEDCTNLETVIMEYGVKTIESSAFRFCRNLKNIILPESITSIGSWAFDFYELNSVIFCGSEQEKNSIDISYGNEDLLNSTWIYHTEHITEGDYCTICKQRIIDNGSCGNKLLWNFNCSTFTLTISGTGKMNDYYGEQLPWHKYVSRIKTIEIENGVTSIGAEAFEGCTRLTKVTIPNSVTLIDDWAFRDCIELTSVSIPNSVTKIGMEPFDNCTNFVYNTYDNAKYLGNSENPYLVLISSTTDDIVYCNINDNTKVIAGRAFNFCEELKAIVLPSGIKSVGRSVFYFCYGLKKVVYFGEESKKDLINIDTCNECLTNATWKCKGEITLSDFALQTEKMTYLIRTILGNIDGINGDLNGDRKTDLLDLIVLKKQIADI